MSPNVGSQISSQVCATSAKYSVSVAFLLVSVLCQKMSLSLGDFLMDKKIAREFIYCILHLGVAPSRIKMTRLVVSLLLMSSFQIPADSDQNPWHSEDALARGCFSFSSSSKWEDFLFVFRCREEDDCQCCVISCWRPGLASGSGCPKQRCPGLQALRAARIADT